MRMRIVATEAFFKHFHVIKVTVAPVTSDKTLQAGHCCTVCGVTFSTCSSNTCAVEGPLHATYIPNNTSLMGPVLLIMTDSLVQEIHDIDSQRSSN